MDNPETLSSLLGDILAGTDKPEYAPVQLGTRTVEKQTDDGETYKEKEPILVDFKVVTDASELEKLIEKAGRFVTESFADFEKGLHKTTDLGKCFPSSRKVLAYAFTLAYLCSDKKLTVPFWLNIAKRSAIIFNAIVDQVEALAVPDSLERRLIEAGKDTTETN